MRVRRSQRGMIDTMQVLDYKELESALREIANDDIADNMCKALNDGEEDGWQETDMAFYNFEPSLTTLIEEYVEANKDVIFA